MSIVMIQIPLSANGVSYGRSKLQADQNGQLQIPDYVAKTLLNLSGVTGPAISGTEATLLAAADDDWEANYLFWAFGQQPPPTGKVAAASALLTTNGVPFVSLN